MAIFMLRGRGYAYWCPTVADLTKPTPAEIGAGEDLTPAITAIQGLEPQSNKINVPVWKHKQELQIDGPQTFQDVTITLVEDDGEGTDSDATARQDALETLEEGAEGVLVMNRNSTSGPANGDRTFSLPAVVGSQQPQWSLDASAATTVIALSPSGALTPGTVTTPAG